jgi:alkanesulfonate monooxygenase SsuD/methylene tetrahydromethanopterin reductase-like flavin-dependent oxidoreductase (luciferase family)
MSTISFGLMLRATNATASLNEIQDYNSCCIDLLSECFTTLWIEDHLQWDNTDAFEALTTLSFYAAAHPRFKIGTLVLSQSYRNPALLAKMMANLQFLTKGRVILGIGTGWKEDEYRAYGYPYPSTKERFDQLEEAILVIRSMWTSQPATFEGKYYQVENAYCRPEPLPTIPLLVGGGGEKRTLGLAARYADLYNYNSCTVEQYAHKISLLKKHCQQVGRNLAEIELTYLSTIGVAEDPAKAIRHPQKHYLTGNASEVIREIEQFHKVGITHFILRIPSLSTLKYFMAAIVPHFF